MWSGKGYQGTEGVENSPLISISWERKEVLVGFSPRSVVLLIKGCILLIPPWPMTSPTSRTSNLSPPTPPPPPPPREVGMVSAVKLSVFKGVGTEEPC